MNDATHTFPVVAFVHIAPGSRLPMKAVDTVVAETGLGLIGDRYHASRHRHVSIQSATALAAASILLGSPIDARFTRRNITISDGDIPNKPCYRINIGSVELEVVRPAAPCRLLDDELGAGAAQSLRARAGSICRVLEGGTISVGDPVDLQPTPPTRDTAQPRPTAPRSA